MSPEQMTKLAADLARDMNMPFATRFTTFIDTMAAGGGLPITVLALLDATIRHPEWAMAAHSALWRSLAEEKGGEIGPALVDHLHNEAERMVAFCYIEAQP